MKNKGFTLIELLAVIVILAIIALIATPMILGVIDTAKRGSAENATLGYIEAVEKSVMLSQLTDSPITVEKDVAYEVKNGEIMKSSTKFADVDFKGEAPNGTITFNVDGSVKTATLTFKGIIDKAVTYTNTNGTVSTVVAS